MFKVNIISKRKILAISFTFALAIIPNVIAFALVPQWIQQYKDGYAIGVIITQKEIIPLGDWNLVKERTFTPDSLPPGWAFHLATTEQHQKGVEFKHQSDTLFGASYALPFLQNIPFLAAMGSSALSGLQAILGFTKKEEERGFLFYEYTVIVVHRLGNNVIDYYHHSFVETERTRKKIH